MDGKYNKFKNKKQIQGSKSRFKIKFQIQNKGKFKAVSKRHLNKLDKFRKRKALMRNETKPSININYAVHNFFSYVLPDEAY